MKKELTTDEHRSTQMETNKKKLHEGWKYEKIGDAFIVERGGSPRPIKKYLTDSPDGLNWVKIGDATASGKYIYTTKQKITRDGLNKTRFVKEGDFLLSNSMSFGHPYIMKTEGCIHDGWLVLRKKKDSSIEQEYLFYILSSPNIYFQFDTLAAGSTVRNLNINLVSSVEIPLPPLAEQKRIVAILDEAFAAIDKAKANAEKNLANAKELFDSYLNGIFANPGEDWEEKKLGEVCEIKGGGTPSKSNKAFYDGNIPWATVRDMQSDILSKTEYKISKEAVRKSATNIIKSGNVIIATRVGLGKACILESDTAINQDLKGIIPKSENEVDKLYLFQWFKSVASEIIKNGTGATVQGVKIPFIESLLIPLPPLVEQKRIVNQLDKISAEVKHLESIYQQKITALEELKKSILKKAFEGEL